MYEESLDDSIFDAMLSKAIKENFKNQLNEIQKEIELEGPLTISEFHEHRMKKLFKKDLQKERFRTAAAWSKKAAAAFAIIVTASSGLLMFSDNVRAAVYGTVIHWVDDITHFTSHEGHKDPVAMEPTYVPNGFFEKARAKTEDLLSVIYTDGKGSIILFNAIPASGTVAVRNTEMAYERLFVDGVEYHAFYAQDAEGQNSVVWEEGGYRYYVSAFFPVETVMKIALSVG